MLIRKYKADDFEQLAGIYNTSHPDEFYCEDGDFSFVPWEDDKYIMSILDDSDVYVCEGSSILGFCGCLENHINWLFVGPESRGQGVAAKLLAYVLPKLEGGATLSVWKSNERAKALYEKFGFHLQKEFSVNFQGQNMLVNKMVIGNST
jgi:ribosomal protein S18 acetylase RimI-like enzyme